MVLLAGPISWSCLVPCVAGGGSAEGLLRFHHGRGAEKMMWSPEEGVSVQGSMGCCRVTASPWTDYLTPFSPPGEGKISTYEGFSLEEKWAMGEVPGSKWWDQLLSTLCVPCQKNPEKLPIIGFFYFTLMLGRACKDSSWQAWPWVVTLFRDFAILCCL